MGNPRDQADLGPQVSGCTAEDGTGVVVMLAEDLVYDLHGTKFDLSPHELTLIHYSGIAFVNLCVILFFFPCAAIRLVLRKQSD